MCNAINSQYLIFVNISIHKHVLVMYIYIFSFDISWLLFVRAVRHLEFSNYLWSSSKETKKLIFHYIYINALCKQKCIPDNHLCNRFKCSRKTEFIHILFYLMNYLKLPIFHLEISGRTMPASSLILLVCKSWTCRGLNKLQETKFRKLWIFILGKTMPTGNAYLWKIGHIHLWMLFKSDIYGLKAVKLNTYHRIAQSFIKTKQMWNIRLWEKWKFYVHIFFKKKISHFEACTYYKSNNLKKIFPIFQISYLDHQLGYE